MALQACMQQLDLSHACVLCGWRFCENVAYHAFVMRKGQMYIRANLASGCVFLRVGKERETWTDKTLLSGFIQVGGHLCASLCPINLMLL